MFFNIDFRGIGNPSVGTLNRLASAMGMELKLQII